MLIYFPHLYQSIPEWLDIHVGLFAQIRVMSYMQKYSSFIPKLITNEQKTIFFRKRQLFQPRNVNVSFFSIRKSNFTKLSSESLNNTSDTFLVN